MNIEQLMVGPEQVFCYILGCEATGKGVVIDPGGDEERILAHIRVHGLTIEYIINTHGHPDHTVGNRFLKEKTGAMVVMHRLDAEMLRDPEARKFFKELGYPGEPFPPDKLVVDGDTLPMGNYSLKVIHTPGHTPGGICIYCAGHLFTGDSLFVGAAGRVDVPGGDFTTLMRSLEAKIAILPDETIVWPGHDYGESLTTTIGQEKKCNPYLGGEW